ncbi:sigma-70 family RNA polymerase sigma factor [Nocardiopsis akebiae]|uniref:Sigma-70 family RNA polymerase sigma factor n=1 Tax=Nocardiopsis akebiae TaxID=2831968 RepID=A0ABX8C7E4_9ACTN|nr:sigma-70 family RNA polymerase sigma factor [Nocardiopsis akebiae]QUX30326.1 sigma-70 family RNA polymerase sigma factor [Nocardiopsis akebiae]
MPTDTLFQEQRPARARRSRPDRPARRPRRDHRTDPPRSPAAGEADEPVRSQASPRAEERWRERDGELDRLALAAREGSAAALDAFVRRTRPDVVRYIARRVHPDRVEDLSQETYLRALRGLPRFAGRAPARTWLLAIARNTVADRYRRDAARPDCVHPADWDLLPGRTVRFDEHVALLCLLDGLAAERRQAFVLTQVEGLSYAEAARLADVPVGTIRSRVARARGDLVRGLTA